MIDIETTDLTEHAKVVDISGKALLNTLNPGVPIHAKVQKIHHITDDMVKISRHLKRLGL